MPSSASNVSGGRLTRTFVDFILRWPRAVLLLFVAVTATLGSQAPRFTIDASPDTLLTRDNMLYTQTQQINQRFTPQEFMLVTYQPHNSPVLSEATFSALRELSNELLALERVESVRSILNVPIFSQAPDLRGGDIDLSQLTIESGGVSTAALEDEFSDHPIYENLLINEDGSATALQVLFRSDPQMQDLQRQITALNDTYQTAGLSADEERQLAELEAQLAPMEQALAATREQEIERIRNIMAAHDDTATIHLGGVHVLGYQLIQIISNDLVVFGSAIGIGICLLLAVLFRAARWVITPLLCCFSSVVSTMGLFAILDIRATVISSNFIALQLILTLAIVIHLIVQYREELESRPDADKKEVIRDTMLRKVGPCFFAGLTTAVGFGSLVFSGIQPVIAFGWMMIIAMACSILASLVLFPALLMVLPPLRKNTPPRVARRITAAFSSLALRHQVPVAGFTLLIALGCGLGISRLTVENSFINYFSDDTTVHQELAYIDQEFGGSTPLDLVYQTEPPANPDIVMSAETVQMLQLIQHRLGEMEATGRIISAVNVTDLARELNGGNPLTEYEMTLIYWMLDESFRRDLVGSFYDSESGEARINIWIKDLTPGLSRAQLLEDIHATLADIGVDPSDYTLSNMFVLYQDILQRLFNSQILTLGLVYAVLTLTFLVIFRSFRLAIAAVIPNIIATLAVLGAMGWLGIPLDLMTITIAAIAMGIAVDDTIHYIDRYGELGGRRNHQHSVTEAHATVGTAILYTTVLIISGFSLLAFSDFIPTVLFGLLTSFSMLIALFGVLALLPVLLRLLARAPRKEYPLAPELKP